MPELSVRLPCPVCLGTTMEKVKMGGGKLEVDHCRRCGGVWLDHGEVQQLRGVSQTEVWQQIESRSSLSPARCHVCHTPVDRRLDECPACGASSLLDCPACDRPMRVESYSGLRLDVCRSCRGVWFDHHELEAIWGASFDLALRRRNLPARGAAGAADVGGDLLFHSLFFAPDLLFYGAYAAGNVASASVDALSRLPEGLAATPEIASSAFEAVGDAAGSVFEVVLEIITGIFDSF